MDVFEVKISKKALKDLKKVPKKIIQKLLVWVQSVEIQGIREVRKLPGLHDEPLFGLRRGQRSIRLSRSYRAFYRIQKDETVELILVEEVNNHEY